jgi:transposase
VSESIKGTMKALWAHDCGSPSPIVQIREYTLMLYNCAMNISSFITPLLLPGFRITEMENTPEKLVITAQSTHKSADCANCGVRSTHYHSSYTRLMRDTPIGLQSVWLEMRVRRFRCRHEQCEQKTFAEQYPDLAGRRRRHTHRLMTNLAQIGLATGGEAGVRLARKLAMHTSPATMIRLVRQLDTPGTITPRIVGIDDWAFRKGRTYGTIIVDHELGKTIDLLPSSAGDVVKEWLEKHPSIEVVTRDRSGEYRDAVTQALPQATQIADRWHLLKNMGEAIERHISKRYKSLCQSMVKWAEDDEVALDVENGEKHRRYAPGPERDAIHAARTEARQDLYDTVKARWEKGAYTTDIAREFNLSRTTVSRWVNSESLSPDNRGRFKQKCLIDGYEVYLRQRLAEGCTNQSQLWREIGERGFSGNRELVSKWIRENGMSPRANSANPAIKKDSIAVPRPKALTWLLIRKKDDLDKDERYLLKLLLRDTKIAEIRKLAHKFMHMIRSQAESEWDSWLETCCQSAVKELRNFAISLKRDEAAVYEAIRQPWSNGATEGHVNRLKLLKRQMYGRANFDLLRLKVLLA